MSVVNPSRVFAAGCLISAAASSMPLLLIGRLLQGIGGGGLTAVSFIATATLFPARLTARVMAAISALRGASAFLGPLIGGLFTEYSTWRMGFVFFALQALFLAGWILLGIRIAERPASDDTPTDIPLGRLTLHHPLVRTILAEQLYRAWTITQNHPYHRS